MPVSFPQTLNFTNFSFGGSYGPLAFGPGTNYPVMSVDGLLDLPTLRSLNVPRAQDQGSFLGPLFAAERIITMQFWLQGTASLSFDALVAALQGVTNLGQSELPLYLDGSSRLANCRVTRRKIPLPTEYQGFAGVATVEWQASDPRVYDANLSTQTIGPGTGGSGFTFPFTFPFTFGAGATGNTFTAVNNGTFPTLPVITISGGAITNPSIQNVTAGLTMLIDISLGTTDTLVIDFNSRTIVLNGTSSRRNLMDPSSRWWALAPGNNVIKFFGTPGAGSPLMTMTWRSAWI